MHLWYQINKTTKTLDQRKCTRKGQQSYPSGTQDIFKPFDGDPTLEDMRFFPLSDDIFKPSIYDWVFMENGGLGDKTGMQRGGRATERRVAF